MENQVTTVVCPNCGANTANILNCEYCGSMLVRYAAADISVDKATFGENVDIISGLESEIKKNLSLQKFKTTDEIVITNIIAPDDSIIQILQTENCNIGTNSSNPFSFYEKPSVALRITFEIRDEGICEDEKKRLNWFKKQDYYFLFTQQNHLKGVYYYIDFGADAHNAAKLISAILAKDYGINGDFSFETRKSVIDNSVNYSGIQVDTTTERVKKQMVIGSIIGAIICIIYIVLYY